MPQSDAAVTELRSVLDSQMQAVRSTTDAMRGNQVNKQQNNPFDFPDAWLWRQL
jgi:hypothetical protein